MAAWPRRGRRRQSGMYGSHPCHPASARGQAASATNNFGVFEAQVRAFNVRHCMEPRIDSRLKSRETVLARHSDMQMGMECPEPVLGHQDLHLADGQVLDVLVLRPGVLEIGRAHAELQSLRHLV